MNKNPFIAFLLAFFPGGGLLYLGKVARGLFYTLVIFSIPVVTFMLGYATNIEFFFLLSLTALLFYVISFIDTTFTASKLYQGTTKEQEGTIGKQENSERFFTIILSFIPGLGHFQLGLVYRGMTLLVSFFGATIMVFFVTMMAGREEFLIFLAFLPIIWFFGFFDALKQLDKKQSGEQLEDKSILDDLESRNADGRKSKAIAALLSIIPGAGHLYLGLQKRGVQLMAAFLFSIYILDAMRLSIFLFIVPIIWFYSFFDGLQKASMTDSIEQNDDEPIISFLIHHQKWLGVGLIALGLYYIGTNIVLPVATPYLQQWLHIDLGYWFYQYFQTAVICIIFIGGGVKLMLGNKTKKMIKEEGDAE